MILIVTSLKIMNGIGTLLVVMMPTRIHLTITRGNTNQFPMLGITTMVRLMILMVMAMREEKALAVVMELMDGILTPTNTRISCMAQKTRKEIAYVLMNKGNRKTMILQMMINNRPHQEREET